VKLVVLFTLAAALQGAAFAQKTPDPELRNERAVSVKPQGRPVSAEPRQPAVSVEPHRSRSVATSAPKTGSSARDLEKAERTSLQNTKKHPKATSGRTQAAANTGTGTPKGKPVKFSYHPPQAAGKKTANKVHTTPSTPSPKQ